MTASQHMQRQCLIEAMRNWINLFIRTFDQTVVNSDCELRSNKKQLTLYFKILEDKTLDARRYEASSTCFSLTDIPLPQLKPRSTRRRASKRVNATRSV